MYLNWIWIGLLSSLQSEYNTEGLLLFDIIIGNSMIFCVLYDLKGYFILICNGRDLEFCVVIEYMLKINILKIEQILTRFDGYNAQWLIPYAFCVSYWRQYQILFLNVVLMRNCCANNHTKIWGSLHQYFILKIHHFDSQIHQFFMVYTSSKHGLK